MAHEKAKFLDSDRPARNKLDAFLTSSITPRDKDYFDKTIIGKMTAHHWTLSGKRNNGDPRIAVYHSMLKGHRKTIIDVVSDDMAFLVDSVGATINKNSFLIDTIIHPILYVQHGKNGELTDVSDKPRDGYLRQSHIHLHIRNTLSEQAQDALKAELVTALEDVAVCNRDWKKMLGQLHDAGKELAEAKTGHSRQEIDRYCAFLDYLYNNNFTLLAYREYEFTEKNGQRSSKTLKGKSLGLLHDEITPAYLRESEEGLPRNLQELRYNLPPVSISKTNRLATVHRRVPMDAVAIKTYDKNGKVKGEKLFLGLFTSVTYSRSVSDVPYLREKVEDVMALSGFVPGSHNGKALRHILEKYPRDELFQINNRELFDICLDILSLQERQRIALFMRRDPFGRYVSCLVYIPRDRFGTTLRQKITEILERELSGTCSNFYTNMDDSVFARVMFTIDVSQKNPPKYKKEDIENEILKAGLIWPERLAAALSENIADDDRTAAMTLKYGNAFPVSYTTRYRAKQAVFDIEKIEQVLAGGNIHLDLYRLQEENEKYLRLKVYNPDIPLNLSDVLPILENMDLRAISELPFEIKPAGTGKTVWIHDFVLETPHGEDDAGLAAAKTVFEEAFAKVWHKEMENDGLNKLVLRAQLSWREVTIIRAYVRYKRQIGSPFGRPYIESALTENPHIAALLVQMFKNRFDPAASKNERGKNYTADIERELEAVESLDHDRILRRMVELVESTVRTNYFQKSVSGQPKPYLSIKLESRKIADLPEPKPYREIFVYSPRVEAVHLRGDKIARGGIRWSDRHEDFRTEILGLMKAQQVKNAVIVPMGAKGGFVVKTPIKDRKAFQAEGIECYRIMIRGLLDITDNLDGEKIIPPKDVVRLDGDDPYLVVAADKGTATFSDIANAISKEYGHWLDDAFASGGSVGYDHKKMGITARGAWESVKLHFRQLNHNIQVKPFDVIGVGDMGGDVFGNGMLLSPHIRLVAAFNHAHIFCDPEPDAASSFAERRRLFDNTLGWDHYDTKKLSKGGRIYERSEKTLTLTPEIQKRFDLAKDKVAPAELIRAILKARADLLYVGGIGTYVKSSAQTHADAGDKTNDALRVDASELRTAVVGEGANLAMTQLARIEFAENGGRINTDFLDNSAGVDTSDHEVNIKILLTDVMKSKTHGMDIKARNKLLEQMTEDVAALVLRDNYQQSQAISLAEISAAETLKAQDEFIQDLERNHGLSRTQESLPDARTIEERLRLGKGMTRPELCILLAYAKIVFTKELLTTAIPDSPDAQIWLTSYFPKALQKKYDREISRHRLRREIIAMSMANSLINRMGPTFVKTMKQKTGASADSIVRAYLVARDAFKLHPLWSSIEALDNKVPGDVQLKAMREVAGLAEHAVNWLLTRREKNADIGGRFGAAVEKLSGSLDSLATPELREKIGQHTEAGMANGLPKDLAAQIARLPALAAAFDIVKISLDEKIELADAARTYFSVGSQFHLDWLRQQARFIPTDTHWQAEAIARLGENLFTCQAGLTVHILKTSGKTKDPVAKWIAANADKTEPLNRMFADLRQIGTLDLPMLVIAEQRLRALYGG